MNLGFSMDVFFFQQFWPASWVKKQRCWLFLLSCIDISVNAMNLRFDHAGFDNLPPPDRRPSVAPMEIRESSAERLVVEHRPRHIAMGYVGIGCALVLIGTFFIAPESDWIAWACWIGGGASLISGVFHFWTARAEFDRAASSVTVSVTSPFGARSEATSLDRINRAEIWTEKGPLVDGMRFRSAQVMLILDGGDGPLKPLPIEPTPLGKFGQAGMKDAVAGINGWLDDARRTRRRR